MDFAKIITRLKNLVAEPAKEWDAIKNDPMTISDVFTTYLAVVAAVPVIAAFIGLSVVGVSAPLIGTVRVPVARGLAGAAFGYLLSLGGVFLGALVVDKLALTFKSRPGMTNAVKLVGFSSLPVWAAGVVTILPMLNPLVALAGLYAIYVCYLGLPKLMETPENKVVPYVLVTVAVMIAINVVVALLSGAFRGY
jgi:hypothetical protein